MSSSSPTTPIDKENILLDSHKNIPDFSSHFKPPIWFTTGRMKLPDNITDDLELASCQHDTSSNDNNTDGFTQITRPSVYDKLLGKTSSITHSQASKYYTTDIPFLNDTQTIIKTYKEPSGYVYGGYEDMRKMWSEIKNDEEFKDRYSYMDWEFLEDLNTSAPFLQMTGLYSIISPVIALVTPIIMLFVPLIILKFRGMVISLTDYWAVLKTFIGDHSICRLFSDFSATNLQDKAYILISVGFYIYSFYQNIMSCIQFHNNMTVIHKHFKSLHEYILSTSARLTQWLSVTSDLKSYDGFNQTIMANQDILERFGKDIHMVATCDYTLSTSKMYQIGYVLKYYYQLYNNKQYESSLLFTFGMNEYLDGIQSIQKNIERKLISFASFETTPKLKSKSKSDKYTRFNESYYPLVSDNQSPIKNTVKMNKSIIITGPNASGKTTLLKSVLINTIMSQQYGVGFYESAIVIPYNYIHCYLNIPDTSGRDSLFQAEARRCKIITDKINNGDDGRHLCGFDELFSGTNPDEATTNTTALLKYLSNNKRVSSILTTHFTDVCFSLDKHKKVVNMNMKTVQSEETNRLTFLYKLQKGISTIRGGVEVLREMEYPDEILNDINDNKN